MAYTKTQWVNNTTPINDTNLNKIEQGIYDNSLVVDAITDTLNPTDTETYKTAELTEGQITDVIGVNDIVIKGQTSQDGTPTPSAPIDINVVSGSNVINTSNKNLFDVNKILQGDWNNPNSSTSLVLYLGKISEGDKLTASNYNSRRFAFIISNMSIQSNQASVLQSSGNQTATRSTFTATANGYVFFKITKTNGGDITPNEINSDDFQIEKGSTATTYEQHQGKELPLDLGKNLANIDDIQLQKNWQNVADTTRASIVNIKVKPSTTYTLSLSYTSSSITNVRCVLFGAIGDITHKGVVSGTFTTTSTTHYLSIEVIANTTFTQSMLNGLKIQLEKGDTATEYVPYDPDPIELCKIGDYQDYFYRDNGRGKWYLHKEIGKTIFNGSETWTYSSSNAVFYTDALTLSQTNSNLFCNRFSKVANTTTYANMNTGEIKYDGAGSRRIIIKYTDVTSAADLKTWLASNNAKVYYPLETVTDTEITDTTLISQLEAIYNAPLYEQTNITQTNNDLPMVLDITACKDNINGIKAFIRK